MINKFNCNSAFSVLALLILTVSCLTSCNKASQSRLQRYHRKAIVIDTHTDTPMKLINETFNLAEKHEAPDSRVDFPRLREGDVDAVFFVMFTGQRERTAESYESAYRQACLMLDSTLASVARNDQYVAVALSSKDIISISNQHKTAICLGMENGFPLAKDISRVKEFHDKGIRYITLCHSSNNDICDSSTDKKGAENNGLSSFGKEVVAEMNRLGIIVDVSHISDKAFYDVLESSKTPVIASHSSVRALCNHPRNLSDDMIKALAEKDGVIQICILGGYIAEEDTTSENYLKLEELRVKYHDWQYSNENERREAWREYDSVNRYFPPVLPDIARAVDHIDHLVKLVGIDHVGIGSDFDGGGGLSDCRDVSDFPKITAELIKRGYSRTAIEKIWGGNFLRVYRAVENYAEKQ